MSVFEGDGEGVGACVDGCLFTVCQGPHRWCGNIGMTAGP